MKPPGSTYQLVCHPDDTAGGVDSVAVDVGWPSPTMLQLLYRVAGDTSRLQIPERDKPQKRDGLWRHTCFELFFEVANAGYCEFNFSPSLQWAAYRFESYREAMADLEMTSPPRIEVETTPDVLTLDASIDFQRLLLSDTFAPPHMALAAIIEHRDGDISHWALAHAGGKPDFHHPDGFVGVLPDNVV
ncbi:MAG: DOMON-like domain-containing protein [Betaproteobacteria bacterium]|nr:MAG: DOMON-like domain-containing protein [Betaproteobacteria bacterium]